MRAVLDLLAPTRCAGCGARAPRTPCPACAATLVPRGTGSCRRCGGPATVGHGCWPTSAPVVSTTVVADYRGALATAIVAAKLGGARGPLGDLADLLAARVAVDPPAVDVVVPLPTSPGRARRRGVDHTVVLARTVGAALGVPVAPLLIAPRRAGAPVSPRPLPATDVLLVDDVLTTGRTAVAAAAALRDAGAGHVHLAVLARAGDHRLVADARPQRATARSPRPATTGRRRRYSREDPPWAEGHTPPDAPPSRPPGQAWLRPCASAADHRGSAPGRGTEDGRHR